MEGTSRGSKPGLVRTGDRRPRRAAAARRRPGSGVAGDHGARGELPTEAEVQSRPENVRGNGRKRLSHRRSHPRSGGTAPATVTQKQARVPAKTQRRGERAPGNPKRHHRTEPAGEAAGATGDTEDAPRQRHEDGARGAARPEGGRRREGAETTTSASRPRGREPRGDQRTRAPGTGPHARPLRPPACARLERKEAGLLPSPVRRPPGQGPLLGDEARDNAARARRRADRLRDTAPCPDGK